MNNTAFFKENQSGGARDSGGEPGLGNTTKSASIKSIRYLRLNKIQEILPDHRVSACMCRLRPGGSRVDVKSYNGKSYYSGLMNCGSVWICPVCASRIMAYRSNEIKKALDYFGSAVLITRTARHTRSDRLAEIWDKFDAACRSYKAGRWYQDLKRDCGIMGTIVTKEITYGDNGWHLHSHEIIFGGDLRKLVSMKSKIEKNYIKKLNESGLDGVEGVAIDIKLQSGSDIWSQYITKIGDLSLEMTNGENKKGGISFFGMLDNEEIYINQIKEYAIAVHGRKRIVWSRGLKDLVGVNNISDEEINDESGFDKEKIVVIGQISFEVFKSLKRQGLLGEFLEIIDRGEIDRVRKLFLI